jgi:exosortase/archaeosortase family protein
MTSERQLKKEKRALKTKTEEQISLKRFGLTYLLLMGIFCFLIGFTPLQKVIDINGVYTKGVVLATSWVLGALQMPCSVNGSLINLPAISLDVRFGCNGLEAVMIYSVAVIAFPAPWEKKTRGILTGFVLLQVANIIRIAGLAYAGTHFGSLFEYAHVYVAQGLMVALALGIFFGYLYYAKPDVITS